MEFQDFKLSPDLLRAVKRLGFKQPTLVQELSIPAALSGRDIVGQSQTGTGKTAAFGLPIIQHIRSGKGPQALIITPTRELCVQVAGALQEYCYYSNVKSKTVYGGVGYGPQIKALKKAEIIVATPGRLLDHISKRNTHFSNIRYLVLDEADKMFEMGFLEDIEEIIRFLPKKRQMFLFSATFPEEVRQVMETFLKNPVFVETQQYVSDKYLKQQYYEVRSNLKFGLLIHLLKNAKNDLTAIIFCATRRETDFLARNVRNQDIKVFPLHGGHSQVQRQKSIENLHAGKINVLVATDIAARGLDIRNVNHIINWDIPINHNEYIHRIGRTARAGDAGLAISFVSNKDTATFNDILSHQDWKIDKKVLPNYKRIDLQRRSRSSYQSDDSRTKSRGEGKSERKKTQGRKRFQNRSSRTQRGKKTSTASYSKRKHKRR